MFCSRSTSCWAATGSAAPMVCKSRSTSSLVGASPPPTAGVVGEAKLLGSAKDAVCCTEGELKSEPSRGAAIGKSAVGGLGDLLAADRDHGKAWQPASSRQPASTVSRRIRNTINIVATGETSLSLGQTFTGPSIALRGRMVGDRPSAGKAIVPQNSFDIE